MQIEVNVTSDFICPWRYIGEKRLTRVIERLATGIEVRLQWLPFELNPDTPPEGVDRGPDALAEIAGDSGLDRNAVAAFLSSEDGVDSVRALERTALARGIQGVPCFDVAGP